MTAIDRRPSSACRAAARASSGRTSRSSWWGAYGRRLAPCDTDGHPGTEVAAGRGVVALQPFEPRLVRVARRRMVQDEVPVARDPAQRRVSGFPGACRSSCTAPRRPPPRRVRSGRARPATPRSGRGSAAGPDRRRGIPGSGGAPRSRDRRRASTSGRRSRSARAAERRRRPAPIIDAPSAAGGRTPTAGPGQRFTA